MNNLALQSASLQKTKSSNSTLMWNNFSPWNDQTESTHTPKIPVRTTPPSKAHSYNLSNHLHSHCETGMSRILRPWCLWQGSPLFAIRQRLISADETEGTIFLLGPLDFEKQATYHLTILANVSH